MNQPTWALAALLAAATAAPTAEPVSIRLKHAADVGKSVSVREVEQGHGVQRLIDPETNKVLKERSQTVGREEVFTETVLQRTGRVAERFQRAYDKAVLTADGQSRSRSYSGRTLLFELQGNRYTVKPQGAGPVDEADLRYLAERAEERLDDVAAAFLPAGPVREGDTWDLDGPTVAKSYGKKGGFDPGRSSGRVRLTKVDLRDGRPVGVIDVGVRLSVPRPDPKAEPVATLDIRMTLDTTLDGSTTAGTMTFSGRTVCRTTVVEKNKRLVLETVQDLAGREEHSAER